MKDVASGNTGSGPVLRCQQLTRRFGQRVAVDAVSFEIARGETYGLLGPNGSGKTTTISMVSGVLAADGGTVALCGEAMSPGATAVKRHVGLVPQDIALFEDISAADNLRFFGRLQGMASRELSARIDEVLDVVGLRDRSRDRISEYSGGMKRRANIAVGLLHRPTLLILDEPTVGVDPQSRNQILGAVDALGAEGMSVLYTTHYMEEAERLCDRIGVLDQGRLIAEGNQRELIERIGAHDVVTVEVSDAEAAQGLAQRVGELRNVVSARSTESRVDIASDDGHALLASIVELAASVGVTVTSLAIREPDLEAVFLSLTGRALRD